MLNIEIKEYLKSMGTIRLIFLVLQSRWRQKQMPLINQDKYAIAQGATTFADKSRKNGNKIHCIQWFFVHRDAEDCAFFDIIS